jgi:phosphoketolase
MRGAVSRRSGLPVLPSIALTSERIVDRIFSGLPCCLDPPNNRESARQWRSALARPKAPGLPRYAVNVAAPGAATAEATRVMGEFLRDVRKLNLDSRNFRLFSPDENNSNRWQDVLEVTNRAWVAAEAWRARRLRQARNPRQAHRPSREYICRYGDDMPEIKNWTWGRAAPEAQPRPRAQRLNP